MRRHSERVFKAGMLVEGWHHHPLCQKLEGYAETMLRPLNARMSCRLLIIHVCLAHKWKSQRHKAAQHVNYVQWAKTWVTQQGMHICAIKKELGAI